MVPPTQSWVPRSVAWCHWSVATGVHHCHKVRSPNITPHFSILVLCHQTFVFNPPNIKLRQWGGSESSFLNPFFLHQLRCGHRCWPTTEPLKYLRVGILVHQQSKHRNALQSKVTFFRCDNRMSIWDPLSNHVNAFFSIQILIG